MRELRTNVSLRVETTPSPDVFVVSGRGELHLSILVETMRREQFEFQVSRPAPVTKVIAGKVHEPWEILNITTHEEYVGVLTKHLSANLGQLRDITWASSGTYGTARTVTSTWSTRFPPEGLSDSTLSFSAQRAATG